MIMNLDCIFWPIELCYISEFIPEKCLNDAGKVKFIFISVFHPDFHDYLDIFSIYHAVTYVKQHDLNLAVKQRNVV